MNAQSYRRVSIKGSVYLIHRIAWAITYGEWPDSELDHIDGNRCNNSIANLRKATLQTNMRNKSRYAKNTTGTTGVSWYSPYGKYVAVISAGGKKRYLGYFDNLDDAIEARKLAEERYGYHPNHGRD